jgi:hypothetical protein
LGQYCSRLHNDSFGAGWRAGSASEKCFMVVGCHSTILQPRNEAKRQESQLSPNAASACYVRTICTSPALHLYTSGSIARPHVLTPLSKAHCKRRRNLQLQLGSVHLKSHVTMTVMRRTRTPRRWTQQCLLDSGQLSMCF